jgi:RimJ/RimL family protein N-acetyltransferase
MQHDISLACVRYRLRPVTLEDAAFIVEIRNDPSLNRFLHKVSPRVEDQVEWLNRYFERPDDYYFIVEEANSGQPQGTVGIYDVAKDAGSAIWGRWVVKGGPVAGVESAWLICEAGFSKIGLTALRPLVLTENKKILSFHDNFGCTRVGILEDYFLVRGERKSAIEYRITSAEWPTIRARHYSILSRLGRRAKG